MTKPANTKVLTYEQRIQLVGKEVSKRVGSKKPSNPFELSARLWCNWLRQEVLS